MNDTKITIVIQNYPNGCKSNECYYKNNVIHNDFGPAIIKYYEDGSIKEQHYYKNGQLYNELGPVFISYHKNGNKSCEQYKKVIQDDIFINYIVQINIKFIKIY